MITNIEKNLQKAWEEAENKGVEKGVVKVAKQMLIKGVPAEEIMEYTGLSEEELEKLK